MTSGKCDFRPEVGSGTGVGLKVRLHCDGEIRLLLKSDDRDAIPQLVRVSDNEIKGLCAGRKTLNDEERWGMGVRRRSSTKPLVRTREL
jgi:hypothetical protein